MNGQNQASTASTVTRVLIVDDHRTFTDLLSLALSAQPDFECIGTAANGTAAAGFALRERPDIVVMDIQLAQENGLEITRRIRHVLPEVVVVVVSAHKEPDWALRAAQAGANAFAPKSGSLEELLAVLRSCRTEPCFLGGPVAGTEQARVDEADVRSLTARELEVLRLMAEGLAPSAIARLLTISLNTCRGHVKSIYSKLGVGSQLQAVVKAQRLGLVEADHSGR